MIQETFNMQSITYLINRSNIDHKSNQHLVFHSLEDIFLSLENLLEDLKEARDALWREVVGFGDDPADEFVIREDALPLEQTIIVYAVVPER